MCCPNLTELSGTVSRGVGAIAYCVRMTEHESPFDYLPYERLDVYQTATHLLAESHRLIRQIPAGYGEISDQLKRAALSCMLNIAEGCGKYTQVDQRRFFGIARGSAMECGAVFDAMRILRLATPTDLARCRRLAIRIVQMLSKMQGVAKRG